MLQRLCWLAAILFSLALVVGCGDGKSDKTTAAKTKTDEKAKTTGKTDGDSEDKPLTEAETRELKASVKDYKDAMARVRSYRDTIRKETTGGNPSRAHRSLDELSLVLEWLPEFAKQSGVPQAKLVDLTKSAQKLNDAFEEVHEKIDKKKKPDYAAVSDTIEAEIKTLDGFTPK